MKLGREVSEATMKAIRQKSTRLTAIIELVTHNSKDKKIRDSGAELIDLVGEWIDEIENLRTMGDEDVHGLVRVFWQRLQLAEQKIATWSIPRGVRRQMGEGGGRKGRRSRRHRGALESAA